MSKQQALAELEKIQSGVEPKHGDIHGDHPEYQSFMIRFNGWCRLRENKTKKDWVKTYCKKHNPKMLSVVTQMPDGYFTAFANVARLINNGMTVSTQHQAHLDKKIKELGVFLEQIKADKLAQDIAAGRTQTVNHNVPKRNHELEDALTLIDVNIDLLIKGKTVEVDFLKKVENMELKVDNHEAVLKYLTETKGSIELALADKSVREYYSNMSTMLLKRYQKFLDEIATALNKKREAKRQFNEAMRAKTKALAEAKKPTKTVAAKPTKVPKLDKFKFAKQCPETKVVSYDPTKLLGAKTVYLVNTKSKMLMKLTSAQGMTVDGVMIRNVDSVEQKTIGRAYAEIVAGLKKTSSLRSSQTLWDSVKTKPYSGLARGTDDTVILFAEK